MTTTTTAAPAFFCTVCHRRIGKTAGHNITDRDEVICTRCANQPANHRRVAPDCRTSWHDPHDHLRSVVGTRAGVAAVLGLWPCTHTDPDRQRATQGGPDHAA